MTSDKAKARFQELQLRAQITSEEEYKLRSRLKRQYCESIYAPIPQQRKLEVLGRKSSRAFEALTKFIAAHSPRFWGCGVPCSYIRDCLTFEDAITAGQLTTVPPPAYGYLPQDMEKFSRPL